MEITITPQSIITAASVLGALGAIVALIWKLFRWVERQKAQDAEIKALREEFGKEKLAIRREMTEEIVELKRCHEQDIQSIKSESNDTIKTIQEEQTLVVYGLLAALKGLAEQGCDGPVSEAIDKIDKHLNQRAHKV